MTKRQGIYTFIRSLILMGVTFFFLLPFLLPIQSMVPQISYSLEPTYSSPKEAWYKKPVTYTSDNMGINLPWLDLHNGHEEFNWLNTKYNHDLIENDLTEIENMGITKVRTFCQMESVFNYKDGAFVLNETYAANLDDYLNTAQRHGISVICVIGDGNYDATPQDLEGHLHWDLIQTTSGLQAYEKAYTDYIQRFRNHSNILMWDICNEPYGSITWSEVGKRLAITRDQVHAYLQQSYNVIKRYDGSTYVGISDIEEEGQAQYELFSDDATRKKYIDDVTDVYAMHIYRLTPEQIADFRSLKGKPKWVLELGAYNYDDPDAIHHLIPASNQLYDTMINYISVRTIAQKLLNSGFTLIMPWAFTSNSGMVTHNKDGSHTLHKLPLYMKQELLKSRTTQLHN